MEYKLGNTVTDPGKPKYQITPGAASVTPDQKYPTQSKEINERLQKFALPFESNIEDYLANNQGKWELLGKATGGIVSEAVLGTLEGASYLLDFEQMVDKLKGAEENYTNWFAESMKEAKQMDALNVYQTKDAQEGFAPGDATWWAKHTPSTIGTALSLMIPAAGVAGIAGKAGSLLGASAKGINFAKSMSATVASRYAESTMEANNVYERAVAELKKTRPELSEEEIRMKAGEAASKTWNTNWVFALQDFMQYNTLLKGFNSASKGKLGKSILEIGKQMGSESLEEVGQFITSEEALRTALEDDADYFGAGFSKRLGDYARNPELHASALLGAVGGGVFTAAGELGRKTAEGTEHVADVLHKAIKDNFKASLEKEVANYVGDTARSTVIDNKEFYNQLSFHQGRGTLNVLKANLEQLEREPDLSQEARTTITNQKEDIDFVVSEEARLKGSKIPETIHGKLIETALDQRNNARLSTMLEKEVEDLYQQTIKEKQLAPELFEMKKLQVSLEAYKELSKTQPQFKKQVAELEKQLKEATGMLAISNPGQSVEEVLSTNRDEQLYKKAFQLASTNEKIKELKKDIASMTTKEGIAKAVKAQEEKEKAAQLDALLKDPNVTVKQLLAAQAQITDPELNKQIDLKIRELHERVKEGNKEAVNTQLANVLPEKPADVLPAPVQQKDVEPADVQPGEVEYEEYFDPEAAFSPAEFKEPTDPYEGLDPAKLEQFGQKKADKKTTKKAVKVPEKDKALLDRLASEEKKDTPKAEKAVEEKNIKVRNEQLEKVTVKSWLKEFAGKWVKIGKDLIWEPEVDVNGYPVEQEYYNSKGEKVKIQDVFASDANGVLLINTPLVKEDDTVVLKVENNFEYVYTPGYKPDGEVAHQIINIYWAEKDGTIKNNKPLAQLDAGDNNFMSAERKQINMDLRKAVIDNGGVLQTTIAAKNIGVAKRSNSNRNSLSILEFDYFNDQFQKLPFVPVLGTLDRNKNISFSGDTYASAPKEYRELLDSAQFATSTEKLGSVAGQTIAARMSPNGTLRIEILQPRKLNEQEKTAVVKQLISAFKLKTYDKLPDLFFLRQENAGIYKAEDGQGNAKTPDLFKINKEVTRVKDQLLIPIKTGWVVLEKDQVVNFLEGKPSSGKTHTYANGEITTTKVKVEGELLNEAKISFDRFLQSRNRNVNTKKLNSNLPFTDSVTGTQYKNYYEFLRDATVLQTGLRGSNTEAYGQDNSYSYGSTTLYLNPVVNQPKVTVDQETQAVESITPPKPEGRVAEASGTPATKIDPQEARKKRYGAKFKVAEGSIENMLSPKEIQWFKDNYGEEFLEIMKGVNKFVAENGTHAFGMYYNALVTLAEYAPAGTAYHEAGHFVFDPKNGLITPLLREKILKEAKKVYGNKSDSELEEDLMRDFEKYKLSGGVTMPKVEKARSFFAKLLKFIKNILGYKTAIQKLYEKIDAPNLTLEQRRKLYENRASLIDPSDIKYKILPGFYNKAQEQEALLAFRTEVVTAARSAAGQLAKVSSFIADKESLERLIDLVKSNFLTEFKAISSIPAAERTEQQVLKLDIMYSMGLPASIGLPAEAGYEKSVGIWEDDQTGDFREKGFKNKLIESFTELGFAVKYDLEINELKEEDEVERIYDLPAELVNPSSAISERVKLFLHSIPTPIINSNGEVVDIERTDLGTPRPLDFKAVDAMLALKLADSINPYTRLVELAESDIISKIILDELEKIKITDPQVFTEVLVKYRRDTIEKKTVLLKEKEEFIELQERDQEEIKLGITKRRVYSTQFIDSNRNSVFRVILDDWKTEGIRTNLMTPTGALTTKVQKIRRDFNALKEKQKAKAIPFNDLRKEFEVLLKEVGVTLPKGVLKEMSELKPWVGRNIKSAEGRGKAQLQERYTRLTNILFDTKRASFESLVVAMEDNKNPYANELLVSLAKNSAVYNEGVKTGAYLNENGDLEYPINTPSYLSELFNTISTKEGAEEFIASKEQDDFYKGNAILQILKDEATRSKVKLSFLSAIRDRDKDPKMFAERTEIDSIISRLTAFVGSTQEGGSENLFASIFIGTPSDKGKNPMMSLPKKKGEDAKQFLFNVLKNTVANEVVRIQNVNEAIGLRERYNQLKPKAMFKTLTPEEQEEFETIKSAGETLLPTDVKNLKDAAKFKYIDSLNQIPELTYSLEKGEISPEDLAVAQAKADKLIEEFINEQYQNFLGFMLKNDMIKASVTKNGTKITNKRIPKGLKDLTSAEKTENFLKEFFYNDTAYRLEMSKLFMGDMALYSSNEDYFKRAYQLVTPGYKGYSEEEVTVTRGVYPEQFKLGVDQKEIQSLVELGLPPEIAGMYMNANKGKGINKTDAQSLATIQGYRKIAKSLGLWNDNTHEVLYQIAWSKGLTARKAIQLMEQAKENPISQGEAKRLRGIAKNTTLQPLKPFQYQTLEVALPSGKTMLVNVQFKDSITPILPELTASHQGYAELHSYMQGNGFDVMSAADTVKVGLHGVVDMTRPAEAWQKQTTPLSNIRFPQLLPSKSKEEVSGTQFHKLIMGDIEDKAIYQVGNKELTGAQLKEKYNELWMEKLANSSASIKEKLALGDNFTFSEDPQTQREQVERLKALLEEEIASRDLNDNYVDALDLVRTQDGKIDFTIPLSFPQLGEKFQGILTNFFKKKIIKQKSPGYSAVNLADYGTKKSDELKYIRNEQGQITEAEIGLALPAKVVSSIGLKYAEHIDPGTNRVRWEKLNEKQKEALQMIIYRIPTSNKSSMLPVRVAMILPSTLNNIVMIPGELTLQMGLDFDVDKSQLLARVLTEPETGHAVPDKNNIDNKLFDLYWSILTSKEHLSAMLTPLSTARLEEIRDNYETMGLYSTTAKSPVFTIQSDVAAESKNREEKAKVGISSRAATAHSVLQLIPKTMINSFVAFNITVDGKVGRNLGNMIDMNGGLISENLGEVQQAALDAAKTPLLALFNITKNLLPAAETMLLYGYPLTAVTDFFMQPVVKEWVNLYNQEKQNENRATEKFLIRYPEVKKYSRMIEKALVEREITSQSLKDNLKSAIGEKPDLDAKILHELIYLSRIGKQMSALTNILSLDTMNDASSMEKLIAIQQQVGDATDPQKDISLDPRIFDLKESPVQTKRIAGFYNYMVKDALQFTSQLYPILTPPYVAGRNHVMESLNLRKTNEETLKKVDQFIHYYSLQHDGLLGRALGSVHPLKEKGSSNPSNLKSFRWSFSTPSKGIVEYFTAFTKKAEKEYPEVLNNELIKALRVQSTNEEGISILGIKNTGDDTKTELIDGWRELFNAENEDIRVLAHDLAYYAIRTSGFAYTPYSFVDLIPIEYWLSTGLNNAWKNVPEIDINGLLTNFARHKFDKIDGFPEFYIGANGVSESIVKGSIKRDKAKEIESFAVSKEYAQNLVRLPRFVTVLGNLYEQAPDNTSLYKRIQPAGNRFMFEMSVDGRNKSFMPEHKEEGDPNPWEGRNKVTEQGVVEVKKPVTTSYKATEPKAKIPQNLVSGIEAFGTKQEARVDIKKTLGPNPTSIDMIEAGFRTRTTRSVGEMQKYNIKVGDTIRHFGKSKDGSTKSVLAIVTAIHPKGTPEYLNTWDKEGWTEEGKKAIERFKEGAAAIEFVVVKPNETVIIQHNLLSGVLAGTNEFIQDYLPEQKNTAKAVLEQLIAEETNPEIKDGLQSMLRNVDKINTPIEAVETPGKLGVFEVQRTPQGLQSVIKINPNANVESASQMRQVLTHELHHAFSVAVLQNPTGEREINFNRNVERLQKEAKERLGEIQGTQDKYEFIAELASNKEFRSKLKKTDLWSRVLRLIRKVLGMKESYDKLLDQYYTVLDNAQDLQKFSPGEFAVAQQKADNKRPEGKKRLDVFEQMLSSLQARLKALRTKGKKAEASELNAALKTLTKTVATNKNAAIIRYLILVNDEVTALKGAYNKMSKTPSKINPAVLNPMRDQLLSYSLLDTFATQIRSNPEDFVPPGGDPEQLLKQLSSLRDEIFKLTEDTKKLAILRVAAAIKERLPEEDFDKLVENLTVADRDITWWSRYQDSFSDINDPIIRGMALKLKDNANEAYRKTQEQLYKGDTPTKVSASVAILETNEDGSARWAKMPVTFTQVGTFKALSDYETWLKTQGKNASTFREKFSPVLDPLSFKEGSEGVRFISPFSDEGKRIRRIKEGSPEYPLKQFYETVVLGYLKSQEVIKLPSQRPGLRVPTIKRSLLEGFTKEKGIKDTANMLSEQFIDNFIERFDDSEYQQVNQHGQPKTGLALRYTSKQDGQDGRLNLKEISLDIASTTTLFVHEMNKRKGLESLQDDMELATQALAERDVMRHKNIEGKGLIPSLSPEVEGIVMADGRFETSEGVKSKAYAAMKDLQDRELYGIVKKRQGEIALGSKKISVSKTVDAFLKFTGLRVMFGAVAIPLTNLLVGELTMLKEVVGGNIINKDDYKAGQKLYAQTAFATLADLGRREKQTHFGKLFTFFNPMETLRPVDSIGLDTTRMRTVWDKIISTGGSTIEYKLAVTAFGAVLNRFKATDSEGKQVSLYDAVDITADGKITLKKGYTYHGKLGTEYEKGKKTLDQNDINEVNLYTLKTYQLMNGVYNTSDKPAAHADVIGRLVNFMRSWLAPGIAVRWNTKRVDSKLGQLNEGHYVSSLIAFNNIYGKDGFLLGSLNNLKMLMWMGATDEKMLLLPNELELSEEEQAEIINLRKANMRKTLFELYTIAALGLFLFAGFDDDDDDSYARYMAARIRREMMTFIDPTTAWDVLRSPTIALNTIESAGNLLSTGLDSGWNLITGEDQEVMQRGPGKDEYKLLYKAKKFIGMGAEYQFEDLDTKTRFIMKGGFK